MIKSKIILLFFVFFTIAGSARSMSSAEEIDAEKLENPRGAQAALCFAYASVLSAETTPEGQNVDQTVSSVLRRSIKQGTRAYDDTDLFLLKSSAALTFYLTNVRLLQKLSSAEALNTLANMRKQVISCSKNLE